MSFSAVRPLAPRRLSARERVDRQTPRREDQRPGSFSINLATGRWADFALPDARGGDPISLAAYLAGLSQTEAARNLAEMLRVES